MAAWSVYIVRCRNGALYTGITTDVPRRIAQHEASRGQGSKFLRGRGPLRLVYERRIGRLGAALRMEMRIKKLSRRRKEQLIREGGATLRS